MALANWINSVPKRDFDLVRCEYDPVYFITKYCYTIDNEDSQIKLIPKYNYIIDLINDIHKPQDNLIEKSRRMTVSWITQAYNIWGLLFGKGYLALNVSRKENLVDDSTVNSLFGKMRFIYDHLPGWMIEAQMGQYLNSTTCIRYCRAKNDKRNNFVVGESANQEAGRGGGYSKLFGDEWGFVPKSETVYAAISDSCKNGKNLITTPPFLGKKCNFYRLRNDAIKGLNNYHLISIHWKQHPLRDQAWYKEQCRDKTKDEVARELDIDWNVSVKGRIYSAWNTDDHVVKYQYQPELPLDLDFDFGIGESPVSVGFSQELPSGETVYIRDAEYHGMSVDKIIPKINEILEEIGYKAPAERLRCWGDPAGKARGATGKSWISEFERFGIRIQYTTNAQDRDLEYGHQLMKNLIEKNKILCTAECATTIDSLENYKRKTDANGNVLDSGIVSDDWAKHRCDGIRYKMINLKGRKHRVREIAR